MAPELTVINVLQNLLSYVLILSRITPPVLPWDPGEARLLAFSERAQI